MRQKGRRGNIIHRFSDKYANVVAKSFGEDDKDDVTGHLCIRTDRVASTDSHCKRVEETHIQRTICRRRGGV